MGCLANFLESARKDDFFFILEQFSRLYVRSAFHFNQMLIYYGNHFDLFLSNEKLEVIRVFSELKIN